MTCRLVIGDGRAQSFREKAWDSQQEAEGMWRDCPRALVFEPQEL
jgi:hypothetical protein